MKKILPLSLFLLATSLSHVHAWGFSSSKSSAQKQFDARQKATAKKRSDLISDAANKRKKRGGAGLPGHLIAHKEDERAIADTRSQHRELLDHARATINAARTNPTKEKVAAAHAAVKQSIAHAKRAADQHFMAAEKLGKPGEHIATARNSSDQTALDGHIQVMHESEAVQEQLKNEATLIPVAS